MNNERRYSLTSSSTQNRRLYMELKNEKVSTLGLCSNRLTQSSFRLSDTANLWHTSKNRENSRLKSSRLSTSDFGKNGSIFISRFDSEKNLDSENKDQSSNNYKELVNNLFKEKDKKKGKLEIPKISFQSSRVFKSNSCNHSFHNNILP